MNNLFKVVDHIQDSVLIFVIDSFQDPVRHLLQIVYKLL